ncbi:hypothetical protein PIB30_082196, partial [Stylosanthes scabra]|nr:hypothetical protein [Stylosanthes scabra]
IWLKFIFIHKMRLRSQQRSIEATGGANEKSVCDTITLRSWGSRHDIDGITCSQLYDFFSRSLSTHQKTQPGVKGSHKISTVNVINKCTKET